MNSFTDFIACAETLIQEKWTTPEKLAIEGRRCGGLLMGGVMNMRPDLFGAVIAGVAFVDVINTLLDETIPLTVIEWEEWGNPQNAEQYRWIRPYSPYDNITAKRIRMHSSLLGSMTHGSVIGSLRSLLQSFVKIGPTTTFYS